MFPAATGPYCVDSKRRLGTALTITVPGANVTAGLLEPPPPHEATSTPRATAEIVKTEHERKCFM